MTYEEWKKQKGIIDPIPNSMVSGNINYYSMYQDEEKRRILDELRAGQAGALATQGNLVSAGLSLNPEETQWLNNELAAEAERNSENFQKQMRDTSYTSTANQLASLGLNPSTAIQAGPASSGVYSNAARIDDRNLAQERKIAEFNNKSSILRTILSGITGLVGAGIGGTALIQSRKAASQIASSTANSAVKSLYDLPYGSVIAKTNLWK